MKLPLAKSQIHKKIQSMHQSLGMRLKRQWAILTAAVKKKKKNLRGIFAPAGSQEPQRKSCRRGRLWDCISDFLHSQQIPTIQVSAAAGATGRRPVLLTLLHHPIYCNAAFQVNLRTKVGEMGELLTSWHSTTIHILAGGGFLITEFDMGMMHEITQLLAV